jgi:hypothetical protein
MTLPTIPPPDAITISPNFISKITKTTNKKVVDLETPSKFDIQYDTAQNYNVRESINKFGGTVFDLVVAPRETTKSQINQFTQNFNLTPENSR